MRANNNGLKTFAPVSRWELIDAISKLHVINDCPSQLTIALDNLEIPCCSQLTKGGQNNCQCSDCGFKSDLTKCTKRQVIDRNIE